MYRPTLPAPAMTTAHQWCSFRGGGKPVVELVERVDRAHEVDDVALLAHDVASSDHRRAEAADRGEPEPAGLVELAQLAAHGLGGQRALEQAHLGGRVDPVVRRVGGKQPPHHLVGGPRHCRHGGDAEALEDQRAAAVLDAGDHVGDLVGLVRDASAHDVRVVAIGDRGERAGVLDAGVLQRVTVVTDAGDLEPGEIGMEPPEGAGAPVDDRHAVAHLFELQGELTTDSPAAHNDHVHDASLAIDLWKAGIVRAARVRLRNRMTR